MTSRIGLSAFVPFGDNARDTARILVSAARENGLDDATHVVANNGGFYISDELADLLGEDHDESEADPEPSEVDKAIDQLETEQPPVADPEAAVDAAVDITSEAVPEAEPETVSGNSAAKATPRKQTSSGNRAAKQKNSEEE